MLIGLGITEYAISLPFLNEYTARGYFSFFFGVVLGKWLYSTQITKRIWHSPLFILMYLLIEALQWSVNLNSVSSMLIFALVTFLVGAVSYFCIEKPLDRVVDKYILK